MTRSSLLVSALVLAALALGSWVNSLLPNSTTVLTQPHLRYGVLNQPVLIRTGSVTATDVQAAKEVTSNGSTAKTTGVFLIVTVQFQTTGEERAVVPIQLLTADGRIYGGSPPLGFDSCGASQPGFAVECEVPFEVAPDAIAGASVVIFNYAGGGSDDRAVIDLEITEDAAQALVASAGTHELARSQLVVEKKS